jgi:hypothetical protein
MSTMIDAAVAALILPLRVERLLWPLPQRLGAAALSRANSLAQRQVA